MMFSVLACDLDLLPTRKQLQMKLMNPYTSPWSVSQPSYTSSPCQLAALSENSQTWITRGNQTCSPRLEVSQISNFDSASLTSPKQASTTVACTKCSFSYPKPANLLTLNLQTSQQALCFFLSTWSSYSTLLPELRYSLTDSPSTNEWSSWHNLSPKQPSSTYSCHKMLTSFQNSANLQIPKASHCKPLSFLTVPDSWAIKIRCTGKHQLQTRTFDDQDEPTYCRSAQDELFETTGYFESSCADWQYIDLIMS